MEITADNKLRKLIVVGDRLLIKPKKNAGKTDSGLFLPPGVKEKDNIQTGYIVKAGPGYPIPMVVKRRRIGNRKKKKSSIFLCKHKKETWLFFYKREHSKCFMKKKNIL